MLANIRKILRLGRTPANLRVSVIFLHLLLLFRDIQTKKINKEQQFKGNQILV